MHNFQGSHDGESKQHALYTKEYFLQLTINYKLLIDAHTLYIL